MRISLIIAAYNRPTELLRFLDSVNLSIPENVEIECLIVDQQGDGRWEKLCDSFTSCMHMKYLSSDRNSISCARNKALKSVEGEIFAIPDDDCVYRSDTISKVATFFRERPEYDILIGRPLSIGSLRPLLRTPKVSREIYPSDTFSLGISYTCFYRVTNRLNFFDTRFGIGEDFGSGGDTDYLIRALADGARGFFDHELVVMHPDKEIQGGTTDVHRERSYGKGMGALLRKHLSKPNIPTMILMFLSVMLIRPIGGVVLNLLRFKPDWAVLQWNKLLGRWQGFLSYRPD